MNALVVLHQQILVRLIRILLEIAERCKIFATLGTLLHDAIRDRIAHLTVENQRALAIGWLLASPRRIATVADRAVDIDAYIVEIVGGLSWRRRRHDKDELGEEVAKHRLFGERRLEIGTSVDKWRDIGGGHNNARGGDERQTEHSGGAAEQFGSGQCNRNGRVWQTS